MQPIIETDAFRYQYAYDPRRLVLPQNPTFTYAGIERGTPEFSVLQEAVRKITSSRNLMNLNSPVLHKANVLVIPDGKWPSEVLKNFAKTCPICQEPMTRSSEVRMKGCEHSFHAKCIVKWLYTAHDRGYPFACPVCRAEIDLDDPGNLVNLKKQPVVKVVPLGTLLDYVSMKIDQKNLTARAGTRARDRGNDNAASRRRAVDSVFGPLATRI